MLNQSSAHANITEAGAIAGFWAELCLKYPPGLLEVVLVTLTQILFFWIPSTVLLLLDLVFPEFSNRHKIQSERRQPTLSQIIQCIQHVAVNNFSGALIQFCIAYFQGFQKSIFGVSPDLPSGKEMMTDFIFSLLVREVLFYYAHRGFHHQSIYKYFHNIINSRLRWHLPLNMLIRWST